MIFKVDRMKFYVPGFGCKTSAIISLNCEKYVKEVSTVLKNDKIVCYLHDL